MQKKNPLNHPARFSEIGYLLRDLPYITPSIPGVGGKIKEKPYHFQVEEVPLYLPTGKGDFLYLYLEKEGVETSLLARELAKIFGISPKKVGFAGRKDKQARTQQWFSLFLPSLEKRKEEALLANLESRSPIKILKVSRHTNGLKAGHILGNRFQILLQGVPLFARDRIQKIQKEIERFGLPNYYGPQRFGHGGQNLEKALKLVEKGKKFRGNQKFYASVFQAYLFNQYLIYRIEKGLFSQILEGDICKKAERGGLFLVENVQEEQKRSDHHEISFTGPIFGYKMMWPKGKPREEEEAILEKVKLNPTIIRALGWKGSRRVGRIFPEKWTVQWTEEGPWFHFFLPKGSYATILLREFQKEGTF